MMIGSLQPFKSFETELINSRIWKWTKDKVAEDLFINLVNNEYNNEPVAARYDKQKMVAIVQRPGN